MNTQVTQPNQPSGAPASVFTQPITKADLDFSRLDRTVDRYRLLLLAKRAGKEAGFTPRMLQLLEYYMAYTTAKDWEEGSRPIVFQSLARTAMDLGVGERQIQKLEKRLFEAGAICWNDSGNHKRYGRRCPKSSRLIFAYGVDLTPLAYLEEILQAKLHQKQLYADAWRATKREISETRRQIRESVQRLREEGAGEAFLASIEANYRQIAYELRSHIELTQLRELRRSHTKLLSQLQQPQEAQPLPPKTLSPIAPVAQKRSRSRAQKVAHQEQTTLIDKKNWLCQSRCDRSAVGSPRGKSLLGNREDDAARFREPYQGPRLGYDEYGAQGLRCGTLDHSGEGLASDCRLSAFD